jgi:hypothetical protein
MQPPWGKHEKDSAGQSGEAAGGSASQSPVERRLTIGLARASQLASMVARSRAARQVEVADLLAGMYIYEWERLSKFWKDRSRVEHFLQRICSISPQRWHQWIEMYDRQRRQEGAEMASPWQRLVQRSRSSTKEEPCEEELPHSSELRQVLLAAAQVSPFRDRFDGRLIPVLTAECVLLCIARQSESEVGRSLRDTGLDFEALESAARDPRRGPHL